MLKDYILNFHENLQGLRDFVSLISPFLDEHGNKVSEKHNQAFEPLKIARKRYFAETQEEKEKYTAELQEIFEGEIEVYEKEKKEKKDVLKTDFETNDNEVEGESENQVKPEIRFRLKGNTDALDEAFKEFAETQFHKELLYKNCLISLVSTVEWFFSQILHYYYDKFPDSSGIKNKTLTLDDLKNFGSINDAEKFLIENKIEEILRGSIKDWFKILKDDLKLGLGYKDQYEDELVEIYQRRNLLVHNGGVVNAIYLSKVADKFKSSKTGEIIEVDDNYLEKAIDKFEITFTLIVCELWKKISDDDEERGHILMELGYRFLKESKWEISEFANFFLCGDKKMPIASRTAAQLNVWLCKKEAQGFDNVKKELDEIDFSDKALIFQVALSALRNDSEFFFKNIEQTLRTEEISGEDLMEFPIFKNMRELKEFKKLKNQNEYLKDL